MNKARLLFKTAPVPLESPIGYLCRVAQVNEYRNYLAILDVAGLKTWTRTIKEKDLVDMARTLRLEIFEGRHLFYTEVEDHPEKSCCFLGMNIDTLHLNFRYPRICPLCLSERAVCWAVWDLYLVTACVEHKCMLIDTCPHCRKRD